MRIVYLITTLGHGKGGHFHSLNTISNEVGKTNEVLVINLGKMKSPVLDEKNISIKFIELKKMNILGALKIVKRIVNDFKPDVIHAFEVESYFFARMLKSSAKKNVFLNKCGGPNPKRYYPKVNNLVLFSLENQDFFNQEERFENTRTYLIPQRVKKVKTDNKRVTAFREEYQFGKQNILRIARISKHYKSSIEQSINLLKTLSKNVDGLHLIVLGTIQSKEVYSDLKKYVLELGMKNQVTFCTNDQYTHNASELLELGDIIVGTGRNFMEASSLNKMLLVPYSDSKFPLLVTNENFEAVKATNFSPRTVVKNYQEQKNLEQILSKIGEEQHSREWFEDFFDVKVGAKKYLNAYDNGIKTSSFLTDTLINYLYLRKHL